MSVFPIQGAGEMFVAVQDVLSALRIAVICGYAAAAIAEFCLDVSGRYMRAGVKPLRMEYLQSRPTASAFAWLCLHAAMIACVTTLSWRWWQPTIFMLGFTIFLGARAYRALTFRAKAGAATD